MTIAKPVSPDVRPGSPGSESGAKSKGDKEWGDDADGAGDGIFEDFVPLSLDEAQKLREANPQLSPWGVLTGQLMAGVLVACIAWLVTGRQSAGWSAFYGSLAVVVPAALFARGLSRQRATGNAGSLLVGFFVWELIKVALTIAMLALAPRMVPQLSWLALLAGFVVTMKVYWAAMWLRLARRNR